MQITEIPFNANIVDDDGRITKPWYDWCISVKNAGIINDQTFISDASTSHSVTNFSETNSALDAMGVKMNLIISALTDSGLLAED